MLEWEEIYKAREIYKQQRIKKMLEEIHNKHSNDENINDSSKRHLCNVAERFKKYAQKEKDPKKQSEYMKARMKCFSFIKKLFYSR